MFNFITWLKKPLIKKSYSTSPLSIFIGVTCVAIARNIPFSKNTFNLNDVVFWARSIAVLMLLCWFTSRIAAKRAKK